MTHVQGCTTQPMCTKVVGVPEKNQSKPKNGTAAEPAGQNSPQCTLNTKISQNYFKITSFTAFHPDHKDIAKIPHLYIYHD